MSRLSYVYFACSITAVYLILCNIFFSPNVKRPIAHSAVVGKDKDIAETSAKWVKIIYERV